MQDLLTLISMSVLRAKTFTNGSEHLKLTLPACKTKVITRLDQVS